MFLFSVHNKPAGLVPLWRLPLSFLWFELATKLVISQETSSDLTWLWFCFLSFLWPIKNHRLVRSLEGFLRILRKWAVIPLSFFLGQNQALTKLVIKLETFDSLERGSPTPQPPVPPGLHGGFLLLAPNQASRPGVQVVLPAIPRWPVDRLTCQLVGLPKMGSTNINQTTWW